MSWTVSEPVPQVDTMQLVRDLLERAAAAHGVPETEALLDQHNEGWTQWYAEHIASTLALNGYTIVRTAS